MTFSRPPVRILDAFNFPQSPHCSMYVTIAFTSAPLVLTM